MLYSSQDNPIHGVNDKLSILYNYLVTETLLDSLASGSLLRSEVSAALSVQRCPEFEKCFYIMSKTSLFVVSRKTLT